MRFLLCIKTAADLMCFMGTQPLTVSAPPPFFCLWRQSHKRGSSDQRRGQRKRELSRDVVRQKFLHSSVVIQHAQQKSANNCQDWVFVSFFLLLIFLFLFEHLANITASYFLSVVNVGWWKKTDSPLQCFQPAKLQIRSWNRFHKALEK